MYYLSKCNINFFLPVRSYEPGYNGKSPNFPWEKNVYEIPASKVKDFKFDCVLFQSRKNYEIDQFEILSAEQRLLPRIYLEHEPPREHPTDTKHFIDDPNIKVVHVTYFNSLMWDNQAENTVIEHGVDVPEGSSYTGEIGRGVVVINNLMSRGRRLGLDVFEKVRKQIPLDLIGIESERLGGLGEISYGKLLENISHYRFFFNPIRYTSFGLAVCEAMMIGMPIVGLSTTEMPTMIKNGISGFVDMNISNLIEKMKFLLSNPDEAAKIGKNAKSFAAKRFGIDRFREDWEKLFFKVISEYKEKRILNVNKPGEFL